MQVREGKFTTRKGEIYKYERESLEVAKERYTSTRGEA